MQKSDASIHGLWLGQRVLGGGHIVPRDDRFSRPIELPEDPVRTRSSSSRELPQKHLSRPVSSSRLWTATLSRAPHTCCSSARGSGPLSSERSRTRSRSSQITRVASRIPPSGQTCPRRKSSAMAAKSMRKAFRKKSPRVDPCCHSPREILIDEELLSAGGGVVGRV